MFGLIGISDPSPRDVILSIKSHDVPLATPGSAVESVCPHVHSKNRSEEIDDHIEQHYDTKFEIGADCGSTSPQ